MADTNGRLARFLWGFVAAIASVGLIVGFGLGYLIWGALP